MQMLLVIFLSVPWYFKKAILLYKFTFKKKKSKPQRVCAIQMPLVFVFVLGIMTWHLNWALSFIYPAYQVTHCITALHCPRVHPLDQGNDQSLQNKCPKKLFHEWVSHLLPASLLLNIAPLCYLRDTTRLSFLIQLITIVDTSHHWFTSLKHQSSGSFNSSFPSHYSSCIFACCTGLRKLICKRSLKPHKGVLYLSSSIRTGTGPTQILSWISYKQNTG